MRGHGLWEKRGHGLWETTVTDEGSCCKLRHNENLSLLYGVSSNKIINSDQGSHFTSERFTSRVLAAGARLSRDERGRYVDNIFAERLWRSVPPMRP